MELARKFGTSYEVVKEAVEAPFAFMYDTLRELDKEVDEMPDFYITRLGRFKVKYKYRKDHEDK